MLILPFNATVYEKKLLKLILLIIVIIKKDEITNISHSRCMMLSSENNSFGAG